MNLSIFRPTSRHLTPSTFRTPTLLRQNARPTISKPTTTTPAPRAPFSATTFLQKRKTKNLTDPRITAIRYHLTHPLTPRPLRFSRTRYLRHWTIHRAWLLFLRKQRWTQERALERQYMSMRAACEALRLLDDKGNTVSEAEAGGFGADAGSLGARGREVGRLYRSAMSKKKVWGSVPVEYARAQVDFPSREGWNHAWMR
ncbi:hypothetical protein P154DRAFT_614947 [Amniculicola lignicola CBS 123094]|uniref:Uncharacterized protein n=1 Tax=Amniculicola lignicola CBS 123094 TaxID=1392246 RepID=A0A6A5X1G7_9PLEO|nr:hypothetical protein P154DRAFT_614947 [Amniculicola lignicola CBS 123094]